MFSLNQYASHVAVPKTCNGFLITAGSGGCTVERRTVNRGDSGSIAVSKLRQFHSPHICVCLSEETLKAGGPFYLVSIPGEVKDPTGQLLH